MEITLITKEEFNTLTQIQKDRPKLTFQNDGYEYINYSTLAEEDLAALETITSILNKNILAFSTFNNFKLRLNGDVVLRFQYDWGASTDPKNKSRSFMGVGYLKLNELLNGFDEK